MLISSMIAAAAMASAADNSSCDCQIWLDDCGVCYTGTSDTGCTWLATTPDFDGDCVVGSGGDWTYILGYYGENVIEFPRAARCDLNGDLVVDGKDLALWFINFPAN